MEDTKMKMGQEAVKLETHLTSAAAFVEGGIQDSCDDACSICLESFCESDPSTVTTCKHEFHLQCILEWCQRSSQCPMCWQPISLKDPTGQELLEAVEHERSFRFNPSRNATIFHHPTLGDFELQRLPVGVDDAELEERIIQHLAAAAAMGRTRHVTRREGQRTRLSSNGHPHYLVFSAHPNAPHSGGAASTFPADIGLITSSSPPLSEEDSALMTPPSSGEDHARAVPVNQQGSSLNNRRLPAQSLPSTGQDQGGPSFSESMKSRFTAVSSKCKESITKSTRGWKERLFSRNTSMADISSEVKREVNAGIATVSRMIERLETRNGKAASSSVSNSPENVPERESGTGNRHVTVTNAANNPSSTITQVSRATDSCPAEA